MSQKQKAGFIVIIFLAIFFRFYQIAKMPGGLFPDMAANGLDVNLMQQGHLQPFYERGNGREALFFYMEWASVGLFGKGVWQFSIVSALFGVLAVVMCYFVTFRLFLLGETQETRGSPSDQEIAKSEGDPRRNRAVNIGLLAMFLMAVSSWHVVLSRTAFRATLIPFFSALTIYFLLRAYQAGSNKAKLIHSFLFGASFALGFYTYIAFRIMAPILVAAVIWPWFATIKTGVFKFTVKKYFLPVVISLVAFFIFFFPLGKYFYDHPGSFLGRAGQVSIFNQTLYTINGTQLTSKPPLTDVVFVAIEVFKTQFMGFFTQGDLNWRQNISAYPFLSPLVSPFFGVGLAVIIVLGVWYFFAPNKRASWWKYYLLLGWFFGMLLPVISTAEGIPHGLRGIGVIPPVFIISAWALYEFARIILKLHKKLWDRVLYYYKDPKWIRDNHFTPPRMRLVNFGLKLVAVCFCLALILQTYFLYFVNAANDPANFYYFRSDLTPVSQYLIDSCNQSVAAGLGSTAAHTYLILDKFSVQTTDYLTSNRYGNFSDPCNVPYQQVDPENSWQLTGLTSADQIVFTQSSMFDTKKFKQYHPEAHLYIDQRNNFNQSVLAVYKIGESPKQITTNPEPLSYSDVSSVGGEPLRLSLYAPDQTQTQSGEPFCGAESGQVQYQGNYELDLTDLNSQLKLGSLQIKNSDTSSPTFFVKGNPWDGTLNLQKISENNYLVFLNQYAGCADTAVLVFGLDLKNYGISQYKFGKNYSFYVSSDYKIDSKGSITNTYYNNADGKYITEVWKFQLKNNSYTLGSSIAK